MPGPVPGNYATIAASPQTARATAAATPLVKLKLAGGDLEAPTDEVTLVETDSSRQGGDTFPVAKRIEGSPEMYCRPGDIALFNYAVLGATAVSGSAGNFVHTATLGTTLPYMTFWKAIQSTVLNDKFYDCMVSSLVIRGSTGGVLTYTATVMGANVTFGGTDPVLVVVSEVPFTWPMVVCSKNAVSPADVESFEITITSGVTLVQTDRGVMPAWVVPGKCLVQGTITMLFQSDADHRLFHTGSTSGTVATAQQMAQALSIVATVDANTALTISLAQAVVRDVPVPPDPAGAPIRSALPFYSKPDASVIANYISLVTKNHVTSYPGS